VKVVIIYTGSTHRVTINNIIRQVVRIYTFLIDHYESRNRQSHLNWRNKNII
jgi:hypothetical protein